MVVDIEFACQVETGVFVKVDVALHTEETDAHFTRFVKSICQQLQPIAFALVLRMNAYGAESPRRLM